MQSDPFLQRQQLIDNYRQMSDDELRNLAADFNDLTDTAKEVLRSEMHSRGLGGQIRAGNAPVSAPANSGAKIHDLTQDAFGVSAEELEHATDASDGSAQGPVEYTWKTLLSECDSAEQANELAEALQKAGIESWIEQPREFYSASARVMGLSGLDQIGVARPRVLVAADQLDQARLIAAQPIPREIVDECETSVPDYTPPTCPKCGAGDPVLLTVDPSNTWKCDQCGNEWSDPVAGGGSEAPNRR